MLAGGMSYADSFIMQGISAWNACTPEEKFGLSFELAFYGTTRELRGMGFDPALVVQSNRDVLDDMFRR